MGVMYLVCILHVHTRKWDRDGRESLLEQHISVESSRAQSSSSRVESGLAYVMLYRRE
jgi:hypothetical protein